MKASRTGKNKENPVGTCLTGEFREYVENLPCAIFFLRILSTVVFNLIITRVTSMLSPKGFTKSNAIHQLVIL